MNKFVVNAAIWAMLNEDDVEENARTVIQYGDALKVTSAVSLTFINSTRDDNDSITGETGHGQVQIQDDSNQHEPIVHEFGIKKERIGHFKMWKDGKYQIRFHHFWKSDPETQGNDEEPVEYLIQYNDNLELTFFGQREQTEWRLWFLAITHAKFVPLYGTGRVDDGWGLIIGG